MKLHRMPLVVQRMIIEELGFDERLSLSFTSKRSCSLLGLFRNDLKDISIEIDIRTWDVSIRVRIPSYRLTERIFAINIRSLISNELKVDLPYKAYYMIGYSDYKIDGSTVQAVKYPSTIRIVLIEKRVVRETNSNLVIVFGKLLRHLNSVLNIQECHQCEFFAKFPVGLFCQLDCSYSYGSIETRTGHIASTTPEDLTFLLDNIKAEQLSLNVAVPSDPGYKYQNNPEKKSSIDLLKISNYSWVDISDLPAARVIFMEIQSCEVNENLQKPYMCDRKAIFNGITRHETQLTHAESEKSVYPSLQLLHNIITVDILRKSDGMRATVIEGNSNNEANRNVFVMVWSEKNLQTIGRAND
ncbi:unnamed protein product [Caenorhabditis nigoni]